MTGTNKQKAQKKNKRKIPKHQTKKKHPTIIQTISLSKGKDGGTNPTPCILNMFYSVLKVFCKVKLWLLFFSIIIDLEEINIRQI